MLNFVNLRKTASGWEFDSEEALEDFVWANLLALFGLTPIKRQHIVKGQFCDILALGENNELVVLELKNAEDRDIVQQLTRYYDAWRDEKPFSEQIDYDRPIRLVAVAPSFHRDNFTDRKYCHLSVEFLYFPILTDEGRLYLQLKDVDNEKVSQVEIPYQQKDSTEDIPAPPNALDKRLANYDSSQREEILRFRRKILSFDSRMQEITMAGSIKYGNGTNKTSKLCAELYLTNKGSIIPFLWLPLKGLSSERLGRAKLCTDWDGHALLEGFVDKGIRVKNPYNVTAAKLEELSKPRGGIYYAAERKLWRTYRNRQDLVSDSMEAFVDLALEKWLGRLK
ncbi:endonuclease NucS domain-containing protein [Microseira wollei]|uniref:Endonuclease NucS C-terminal domain-containing protein n=1 Tax=Microseira wollei NIES-4236 TaxID=2530354 RepID=A0AAV3XNJ7_9CYAN|nr:endonuclease NucS domain-containing protein [Microseira wollei]GET42224.1 hypothetical protein MiSe_70380 [Microseira wollei NIES-4236]